MHVETHHSCFLELLDLHNNSRHYRQLSRCFFFLGAKPSFFVANTMGLVLLEQPVCFRFTDEQVSLRGLVKINVPLFLFGAYGFVGSQ